MVQATEVFLFELGKLLTIPFAVLFVIALISCQVWLLVPRTRRTKRSYFRRFDRDSRKILNAVARHANDGLIYHDMNARILWANDAYCRIMGYRLEEIIGRRPHEFCFPPELRPSDHEIHSFRFDIHADEFKGLTRRLNIRKNGERFWHEFSLSHIEDQSGRGRVVLVSRDVTEQVAREEELTRIREKLQHAAKHDALTGLCNRAAFQSDLIKALSVNTDLGLIYIDLDRFKVVNDTHGHPAGDAVLLHVAEAIRATSGDNGLSCRVGGDEFLVACPGVRDLPTLEYLADNLIEKLSSDLVSDGVLITPSASMGIAVTGGRTIPADDLIRMADFALYEAKAPGAPSIMRYDADLHARKQGERETVEEFAEALGSGGLHYVFQPILDAQSGTATGFETLVRWRRKNGTLVGPDQFLDFGARLKRLPDIDFAAARNAARLTADLRAMGHDFSGSFNVSSETLSHPDFMKRLMAEVKAAGITPRCLNVEVLETTFFAADARDTLAAQRISDLRGMGTKVYLDDFGIGYAGLAHLSQLDVTGIKIDRSLTADVVDDRSARLIASSILQLCQELSIEVCIEGIEYAEQAALFQSFGAQRLQGFGIAKPMTRDELVAWIRAPVGDMLGGLDRFDHSARGGHQSRHSV